MIQAIHMSKGLYYCPSEYQTHFLGVTLSLHISYPGKPTKKFMSLARGETNCYVFAQTLILYLFYLLRQGEISMKIYTHIRLHL